ncbi:MAG TPA: leucyl aminopeptidase, partial [Acidisphaera sp.]|nr:leucyl aminopeptidase [Acidisphaera sp.]
DADAATSGAIGRALSEARFTGERGKTCTILSPGAGLARVVAVGLGKDEPTACAIENAGGTLASALTQDEAAAIAADQLTPELAAHAAFGAVLRAYRFDRYRTKQKPDEQPRLAKLVILTTDPSAARAAWETLRPVAEAVHFTRDLVSEPANVLTPAEFARRCEALTPLGVKVTTLGPKELEKAGFGALLAVAQGSANEPRVVVMQYSGTAPRGPKEGAEKEKPARRARRVKPLAFIGKGVTFDTGGISIKPAGGMEDMKWDMAGAGAVVGLMMALAGRRAKAEVVGLIGLVENMPSGTAQRPGDVVKSLSGQTIEVINTDAEGRLVLADVIAYCQQKFDPAFMVDLATLTGAIIIGLGHEHAGLFANDDTLAERLFAAGKETGEKVWRMPLDEAYDKQLRSDIADMKNVGGRPAGSCTAAQFIQRFVDGTPWAHLDVAGMVWSSKDAPATPKGATGFGVRLLNRFVAENYES